MIVERSVNDAYLSNSWLVADAARGHAVLIDTGGPQQPLLARIERDRLRLTHVLCTHHHIDHICHNEDYRRRFDAAICGHASEREGFGRLDLELSDGQTIETGGLTIRTLHVPGHTVGQLAFVVNDERVFSGDTLFRRSVGGTCGPGHASFEELRRSILDVLMQLPHAMSVHPGHSDPTNLGEEWDRNPFVRLWRGLDDPEEVPCEVGGRAATLMLRAVDYDGGTKCQVRFDDGHLAVVGGSQVREHNAPPGG